MCDPLLLTNSLPNHWCPQVKSSKNDLLCVVLLKRQSSIIWKTSCKIVIFMIWSKTITFWITWSDGEPSKSVMSSNWCTTFLPGNRGFPCNISAKMHPILQISIAGEYLAKKLPQSSGALYHLQEMTFLSMIHPKRDIKCRSEWKFQPKCLWLYICFDLIASISTSTLST